MSYGPQIQACRLYECESKSGNTYFRGRWGSMSVVMLKSKEIAPDSGAPIWNLLLSEAPQAQPRQEPKNVTPHVNPTVAAQPQISNRHLRDAHEEIMAGDRRL